MSGFTARQASQIDLDAEVTQHLDELNQDAPRRRMVRWHRLFLLAVALFIGVPTVVLAGQSATLFPTSLDTSASLCNPTTSTQTTDASCGHAELHTAENAAIKAVEAKLGTGASTPQSGTYFCGTGTGVTSYCTPVPTATAGAGVNTPTPFPTCAVGVIAEGTGGQGLQCGSMALTTATPVANCVPYDSAGGAGSVLACATFAPTSTAVAVPPTPAPTCAADTILGGTGAQGGIKCSVAVMTTATPPAGTVPYCSAGGSGCVLTYVTPASGGSNAFKELCAASATASQSVTATASPGTDLTSLTCTVTPDGTHPIIVEVLIARAHSGTLSATTLAIQKDSGVVQDIVCAEPNNSAAGCWLVFREAAPTNASHTYKASAWSASANTITFMGNSSATEISYLRVTQVQN